MKPVIKKQTHYSMLLMRDDSEVRSFRLKNATVRFFVIAFCTLMICSAAGIGIGVHYWKRYTSMALDFKQNERDLTETRLQLEQLSNMKALLLAGNSTIPLAKNQEVGAEALVRAQNATQAPAGLPTPGSGAPAAGDTRPGSADTAGQAAAAELPLPAVAGSDSVPEGSPSSPKGQAAAGQATSALARISGEGSPVRINNFSGRATSQQRVRIRYELSTTQEQSQISGTTKYAAFLTNGTRLVLDSQAQEDTRFAIRSMKRMDTGSRLPQGYLTKDIESFEVTIETDDGTRYSEKYPVSR